MNSAGAVNSGSEARVPVEILIPQDVYDAVLSHASREHPLECCGLLGGVGSLVDSIFPLRNVEHSEVRYSAHPTDLIQAVIALRKRSSEILVIYHSHPASPAIPSRIDLEANYYGDLPRMIVSLEGEVPVAAVWQLGTTTFKAIPWRVL